VYEAFYGFNEKPFSILPDPSFLYLSKKHQRALTMLEYGVINQAGFSVVTGAIGSGKTTLVRKLLESVDETLKIGLISNTHCDSFEELLQWIHFSFELDYQEKDKVALYDSLTEFLVQEYGARRRAVLIIDEAQNLSMESLEQLRMLSNVNAGKHQLLQLILVGQPGLRIMLRQPQLEQFAQRIAVAYHLAPLDEAETEEYIRHRLRVAGGVPELFTGAGCQEVWSVTGGVPRLINILCDSALVYGFADQYEQIDVDIVRDVVRDRQIDMGEEEERQEGGEGGVPILTDVVSREQS
jgi:general secretion pathway protein A